MVGAVVKPKKEHNDPFDLGPMHMISKKQFVRFRKDIRSQSSKIS